LQVVNILMENGKHHLNNLNKLFKNKHLQLIGHLVILMIFTILLQFGKFN